MLAEALRETQDADFHQPPGLPGVAGVNPVPDLLRFCFCWPPKGQGQDISVAVIGYGNRLTLRFRFFVPVLLGSLCKAFIEKHLLWFANPSGVKAGDDKSLTVQMFGNDEHIFAAYRRSRVEPVVMVTVFAWHVVNRVGFSKCLFHSVKLPMQLPPLPDMPPLRFRETDVPA